MPPRRERGTPLGHAAPGTAQPQVSAPVRGQPVAGGGVVCCLVVGRPPWLDVARPCLCHPTSFPRGRGVGSGDPLHTAPCAGSRTPRVQPGAPAHMYPSYQRTHARYGRHRPSDPLGWRQQQARAIHSESLATRSLDRRPVAQNQNLTSPSSPSAVLPSAPGTPLPGARGLLPCWA